MDSCRASTSLLDSRGAHKGMKWLVGVAGALWGLTMALVLWLEFFKD